MTRNEPVLRIKWEKNYSLLEISCGELSPADYVCGHTELEQYYALLYCFKMSQQVDCNDIIRSMFENPKLFEIRINADFVYQELSLGEIGLLYNIGKKILGIVVSNRKHKEESQSQVEYLKQIVIAVVGTFDVPLITIDGGKVFTAVSDVLTLAIANLIAEKYEQNSDQKYLIRYVKSLPNNNSLYFAQGEPVVNSDFFPIYFDSSDLEIFNTYYQETSKEILSEYALRHKLKRIRESHIFVKNVYKVANAERCLLDYAATLSSDIYISNFGWKSMGYTLYTYASFKRFGEIKRAMVSVTFQTPMSEMPESITVYPPKH